MDYTQTPSPNFFREWDKHIDVMTKLWKPRPRHVIFCDSRGKFLHQHIVNANKQGHLFTVYHFGGNTIRQLIVRAEHHLTSYPRDCVYILGGQCDITTLNRSTRKVSLDWSSEETLATHLIAYTEVGLDWIMHYHPEGRVVICPLTGCDVSKKITNNRPGLQEMGDWTRKSDKQNISKRMESRIEGGICLLLGMAYSIKQVP